MALTTGLLLLPTYPPSHLAALAQLAEHTGYDALWLADERFFREVYASLTLCALRTERIKLGPCVTDPYSRHPALTAMAIATLDEISGQRAVLGLGAGVSGFRELGIAREQPATAMREAIEVIRRLLAGERVSYHGQRIALYDGRLDFTPVRAEVPIYVASQRPLALRMAGRLAEGAIMQGCVAEPLVRFFRQMVSEGARRSGRDPSTIDLAACLNVCIDDDRRAAQAAMKPSIARSLVSQAPDFFTFVHAGLTVPPTLRDRVLALPYTHDPVVLQPLAAEIPDAFVQALTLAGPPAEVAAEVTRLARAGITQLIVAPDGDIEATVERFQAEVMPQVRAELRG
ncbi:MAG TPA: LLM class flavin-dependent oxidoreductase [Alphaproteobacteria bacterium]|nr:LLM class flavin-dependent oxidoreductase [Alphaproteobacteria bacterium]